MTASYSRHLRLEELLLEELQSTLRTAADPHLESIVVLRATLSPDAGHARVAYACRDEAAAAAALTRATGYLRAQLAQLNLKKLPQLSFTCVGVTG